MSRKSIAKSPVEVKENSRLLAPLSLSVHVIHIEATHLGELRKIRNAVEQLPEPHRQYVEAIAEGRYALGGRYKISYCGKWFLNGQATDSISDHFAAALGYE